LGNIPHDHMSEFLSLWEQLIIKETAVFLRLKVRLPLFGYRNSVTEFRLLQFLDNYSRTKWVGDERPTD